MDKSKAYIKKMQKADEITSMWKPQNGDYFFGTPEDFMDEDWDEGVYQYFECDDEYYCIVPKYYNYKDKEFTELDHEQVYLPTQAELQALLLFDTPFDMIQEFSQWVEGKCRKCFFGCIQNPLTFSEKYHIIAFIVCHSVGFSC